MNSKHCLALISLAMAGNAAYAQDYVGDQACLPCHEESLDGTVPDFFDAYKRSGHPWKLFRTAGQTPDPSTWPETPVPPLPVVVGVQLEWPDVQYVIGNFFWKARFVDPGGFIWTGGAGDKVQWNIATQEFVPYHAGEVGKPFNCGRCHTTGYDPAGNQEGLPGLVGTWTEEGIRCEACHGPGSGHAADPEGVPTPGGKDCSECHYRDSQFRMPWKGGFMRHHQQAEDLAHSPHKWFSCDTCHNPHRSVVYHDGGVIKDCNECHPGNAQNDFYQLASHPSVACIDCHMPRMGKSATASNQYTGDVRGHLFDITREELAAADNVFAVGSSLFWNQDASGNSVITLDYACLGCHADEGPPLTLAAAAAFADNIHNTISGAGGPPPVNQKLGMLDVPSSGLEEADCRVCHDSAVPDRHHLLLGQPIAPGSLVPVPDADGDGSPDSVYGCLNCHDDNFVAVRDCTACHTGTSPHHATPTAQAGDCVFCHGDIVDNMDDGHYIPVYEPSLVTPASSGGTGLPTNNRGNGAGACDYCHEDDGLPTSVIESNYVLHHSTGFVEDGAKCAWCHDLSAPVEERIRTCEGCHGPDSLHNIQADSPNPNNIGTVVVGQEDAGFGHIGADAGPGNSDCWGCHGFDMASAPRIGPVVPTIHSADRSVMTAGSDALIILSGAAFTNMADAFPFVSDVVLTAADGSSATLTPDAVTDEGILVTIPADTAPGNYTLRAVKVDEVNDNAEVASNPAVISVIPEVTISTAKADGKVTITGSGFGGYAAGSGTSVTKPRTWGWGRWARTTAVEAKVISWSDTEIVADFGSAPKEVTVNSVFGDATAKATSSKPAGGARARSATALFGSATTKSRSTKPAKSTKPRQRTRGGWWWW